MWRGPTGKNFNLIQPIPLPIQPVSTSERKCHADFFFYSFLCAETLKIYNKNQRETKTPTRYQKAQTVQMLAYLL